MPCRQQCTSGVVQCQGTDCILLSGTGVLGDPLEATPVIDPNPTNALSCGPTGLFVPPITCPPDLWADGGVPPGSLPIVSGVNFGGNPLLVNGCPGKLMAAYGPQADVLLTNTTSCSFAIEAMISPTQGYFILDPGASLAVGWVAQVTGINLPPAPIVFPGQFYGGVNENNPSASLVCGVNADSLFAIPPVLSLTPGDFVWVSLIAVLYITGAGPSTTFSPVAGQGPQIHLRGLRL